MLDWRLFLQIRVSSILCNGMGSATCAWVVNICLILSTSNRRGITYYRSGFGSPCVEARHSVVTNQKVSTRRQSPHSQSSGLEAARLASSGRSLSILKLFSLDNFLLVYLLSRALADFRTRWAESISASKARVSASISGYCGQDAESEHLDDECLKPQAHSRVRGQCAASSGVQNESIRPEPRKDLTTTRINEASYAEQPRCIDGQLHYDSRQEPRAELVCEAPQNFEPDAACHVTISDPVLPTSKAQQKPAGSFVPPRVITNQVR